MTPTPAREQAEPECHQRDLEQQPDRGELGAVGRVHEAVEPRPDRERHDGDRACRDRGGAGRALHLRPKGGSQPAAVECVRGHVETEARTLRLGSHLIGAAREDLETPPGPPVSRKPAGCRCFSGVRLAPITHVGDRGRARRRRRRPGGRLEPVGDGLPRAVLRDLGLRRRRSFDRGAQQRRPARLLRQAAADGQLLHARAHAAGDGLEPGRWERPAGLSLGRVRLPGWPPACSACSSR